MLVPSPRMENRNTYSFKLSAPEQASLTHLLRTGNFRPATVPYARIAGSTADCNVVLYESGKCVVQGKGAADFVTFVMEPVVLQRVQLGYEEVVNPEMSQPRIGVDESGKGDFFGPLVVVAAYVDSTLVEPMQALQVRDSKCITSDNRALDMGRELRKLLGKRFSIVQIGPEAYNRLYVQMRSVNRILAWAHARAIENMLDVVPKCPKAISDQFGSKEQVERALMKKGRTIELVQRHRAESDLAVAAASVIARDGFLRALKDMEKQYGQPFPKGASVQVRESAAALGKKLGPQIFVKTAKCHFRTTDQVLSAIGSARPALGPLGAAVSKPFDGRFRHKHHSAAPAEPGE